MLRVFTSFPKFPTMSPTPFFSQPKLIEFHRFITLTHKDSVKKSHAKKTLEKRAKKLSKVSSENSPLRKRSNRVQSIEQGTPPEKSQAANEIKDTLVSEPKTAFPQPEEPRKQFYNPAPAKSEDIVAKRSIQEGNYYAALNYYNNALNLRLKGNAPFKEIGQSLNDIGSTLLNLKRVDESITQLSEALAYRKKNQPSSRLDIAITLRDLGNAHFQNGNYLQTYEHHLEALQICEKLCLPTDREVVELMILTGNNLQLLQKHREALEYYVASIDRIKQAEELKEYGVFCDYNPDFLATLYTNIGLTSLKTNNYKQALEYFSKALSITLRLYGNDNENVQYIRKFIRESLYNL